MIKHLFERLVDAKEHLQPIQSKYRVLFEDPIDPDSPVKILVPDPNWLACALAGNILPPVEAYHEDAKKSENEPKIHPYVEPIGPMTEEEAIEYLIMKDIPPRIWRDYKGNRTILKIVPVNLISSDRTFRNAWTISQE